MDRNPLKKYRNPQKSLKNALKAFKHPLKRHIFPFFEKGPYSCCCWACVSYGKELKLQDDSLSIAVREGTDESLHTYSF